MSLLRPNDAGKVFRFAVVGIANTGVDIAIFSLLHFSLDMHLLLANTLSYLAAASNSFFLNKYWTFSDTRDHGQTSRQFGLFLSLGIVGLGLSNLVVWALAAYLPAIVAKLLSIGVLFVWNFGTSHYFVFRAKQGVVASTR